jgi:glycosyltransferase involved in cell wall biosynthesis
MRICIVTHKVLKGDGQGRVNYEVVLAALKRGHDVTVLASEIDLCLQDNQNFQWIPISVSLYPSVFLKNFVFSAQAEQWLKLYGKGFDMVKLNGSITNFDCHVNAAHFVHSAWLKSPSHISKHQSGPYAWYQLFYNVLNAYWEKQAFSRSQVIVAVSSKVKQEILQIGVAADKIQVVLNGVDLQEFYPGKENRSVLGLPEAVPLALFAGDIRSNRKNLDTVLRALVEVPQLHLAVIGSINRSTYPALAQELGLTGRVHFMDFRRDISALMRASDFFVFPSRYEACTLVLLEAMASGLPVITAVTTGGSEIVNSQCGIVLSDSEDVMGLATAMSGLTDGPERCQEMGLKARQVAEQYSWQITAHQYISIFEGAQACSAQKGCSLV